MKRWAPATMTVAFLLIAGCSSSSGHHSASGPTPSPTTRASASSSETPSPSQTPATSSPSPVAASLPAGGPVPAGFEPQSVTFVSTEVGYVLGTTPSCSSSPCTSLVRTTDGGQHWVGVPAPRAALTTASSTQGTTVGSVRFADALNGYVFGPALWVTHDGARSWHQAQPGGSVVGLATAGGRADAVVQRAGGTQVLTTPVTREAFTAVTPNVVAPAGGGPYQINADAIVLHPPAGFALVGASGQYPNGHALIYAENATGRWALFPDACYQQSNPAYGFTSFAAPDAIDLFSLCTGDPAAGSTQKGVVLTRNGRSITVGAPPNGGDGGQIAAASASTLVVASRSAASWLYRSTDGGRTWKTAVMFSDGGAGLTDLGFTTATQGVVIHGRPASTSPSSQVATPDQLLMTRDAGATWQPVTF